MDLNSEEYLKARITSWLGELTGELAIMSSALRKLSDQEFNATTAEQKFRLGLRMGTLSRAHSDLVNIVVECFPKLNAQLLLDPPTTMTGGIPPGTGSY